MNGAQALLKALVTAGIDTCFANPGTSEMQLVYEIGLGKEIRPVLCLQENTATGAADGFARMAGRPAMTLLHVGGGFANGMANLHNAGRAESMVLNVVGANATYHQPNFPEHELINGGIVDLARVVSHWSKEARSADELATLGAQAVQIARSGVGKICTLITPTNCHWEPAMAPPTPLKPLEPVRVATETIRDIAAKLTNGKKTAILLGGPGLYGYGLKLAGAIADRTGADLLGPTFPTRMTRGEAAVPVKLIPYFVEAAIEFMKVYDQLILIAAERPVTIFAYQNKPLSKIRPDCEVSVLATSDHNVMVALSDLAKTVQTRMQPVARTEVAVEVPESGALNGQSIGKSIRKWLPIDSILVDEAATLGFEIFEQTRFAKEHDYLYGVCGGAIGGGLPLALGASIACPDRKVVALEGDGCAMYTVQALWSMARENANIVIVIMRNDNYAILEIEMARVRTGELTDKMKSMMSLSSPTIDWVHIASAYGIPAKSATTPAEFDACFEQAMSRSGPFLIEACVEQDLKPQIDRIMSER